MPAEPDDAIARLTERGSGIGAAVLGFIRLAPVKDLAGRCFLAACVGALGAFLVTHCRSGLFLPLSGFAGKSSHERRQQNIRRRRELREEREAKSLQRAATETTETETTETRKRHHERQQVEPPKWTRPEIEIEKQHELEARISNIIRKSNRLKNVLRVETPSDSVFIFKLFKLDEEAFDIPHDESRWRLRDFWIGKSGALYYHSLKENGIKFLFEKIEVDKLVFKVLPPEATCKPFSFSLGFPSCGDGESSDLYEPTLFAAPDEETLEQFMKIRTEGLLQAGGSLRRSTVANSAGAVTWPLNRWRRSSQDISIVSQDTVDSSFSSGCISD